MLAILSNNHQLPKFTPRQYFILYSSYAYISKLSIMSPRVVIGDLDSAHNCPLQYVHLFPQP